MERVGIYNRCSTEEESQVNALAVQAEESREIAHLKNWMIVEQYIESQSGTSAAGRREYLRMLADTEAHRFTVIMIKSIDRLARNVKDWYLFLDCIARNKVRLYIYIDNKFYTPDDSLITGIKAILAEEFSRELSKKIRNSHRRRQEKRSGFNITSEMFGWDKKGTNVYEINETEASYYRDAFELAEQGFGYRRISNTMYEAGARSKKGTRISQVQWRNMLRSPRAHGTMVLHYSEYDFETKKRNEIPQKEWIYIENALPAIVSKEYQNRIIAILDERAAKTCVGRKKNNITGSDHVNFCNEGLSRNEISRAEIGSTEINRAGKYVFSGKLICSECGKKYYRCRAVYTTGPQVDWKCSGYLQQGGREHNNENGCDNIKVDEETLYELVEMACKMQYSSFFSEDNDLIEETVRILRRVFESSTWKTEERKIEQKIMKLKESKDKLLKKLLAEVISDEDYKNYRDKIDGEMEQLERRLNQLTMEAELETGEGGNKTSRLHVIEEELKKKTIIDRAKCKELINKVEKIIVHPEGILEVKFGSVNLTCVKENDAGASDDTCGIMLQYTRICRSRKLRMEQKESVYNCIKENRHIKITEIMEMLDMKQSTVYQRIKELKKENRVVYQRQRTGGYWEIL